MSATPIPVLASTARPPDIALIVPADLAGLVRAALTTRRMRLHNLPDLVGAPARYMVTREDLSVELTERERQVLLLIAGGNSNGAIAKQMHLSPDAVRTHLSRMFRKLGVHDRAHAVAVGYQQRLLGGAA